MRFDKPVGIWLLWFPTAWALWMANEGKPSIALLGYFFAGTVLMRAAGCVVNDMADRHVDRHVTRTKERPLATGDVSLPGALVVLIMLLLLAFLIVIQLPRACFYEALVALFITLLYPFCKRFFQAPQFVLGLAFSMGIPMAYTASGVGFDGTMWGLFLINVGWIVSYDTEYAMVDRADDKRIGVNSTAVLFAHYDRWVLGGLHVFFHGGWLVLIGPQQAFGWFGGFWFMAGLVLIYQQWLIRHREPSACFRAFLTNGWYGLLMWLALF